MDELKNVSRQRYEKKTLLNDPGYFMASGRIIERGKMPNPGRRTNLKFILLALLLWFGLMGGLYLASGWRFIF